jgi:hypothetical protein
VRKFLLLIVGVVATVAIIGQAGAAKPFTHATGGVTLASPTQTLSFDAFDYGATGDRGTVSYSNLEAPGVTYTASVFCANVDPATNTALFAYLIPPGNSASGIYVIWKVVDGGTPGTNGDTAGFTTAPDRASAIAACNSLATGVQNYAITDGDLVVHG